MGSWLSNANSIAGIVGGIVSVLALLLAVVTFVFQFPMESNEDDFWGKAGPGRRGRGKSHLEYEVEELKSDILHLVICIAFLKPLYLLPSHRPWIAGLNLFLSALLAYTSWPDQTLVRSPRIRSVYFLILLPVTLLMLLLDTSIIVSYFWDDIVDLYGQVQRSES